MDSAKVEEEEDVFSEWEVLQYSPRTRNPTTQNDTIDTPNSPILLPSHSHEPSPPSSSYSSSSSRDFPVEQDCESTGSFSSPSRVIENAKKLLGISAIFNAVQRISNYVCRGRAFRSYGPAAGALGTVLMVSLVYVRLARCCGRRRRRRIVHEENLNPLVLQLKDKDQEIRQLLQQIARLNDLLSSRRRVQVIRIA